MSTITTRLVKGTPLTFLETDTNFDNINNDLIAAEADIVALQARTGDADSAISFRNRIINGDMRIDQRNVGGAVVVATNAYGVDRWSSVNFGGGQTTVQRTAITNLPGFPFCHRQTVSTADTAAAGDYYQYRQAIEGTHIADFLWGTANAQDITLSFWVRSSLIGSFSAVIQNGTNNRTYPFSWTISVANTWEYKTINIPGDTSGTWSNDTGAGMYLIFDMGSGTTWQTSTAGWQSGNFFGYSGTVRVMATLNATFDLTGVQLEAGAQATPFERRSYAQELALCQRYYCKTFQQVTVPVDSGPTTGALWALTTGSAIYNAARWEYPVTMRVAPTITTYSVQGGTAAYWRNSSNTISSQPLTFTTSDKETSILTNNGGTHGPGVDIYYIQAAANADF